MRKLKKIASNILNNIKKYMVFLVNCYQSLMLINSYILPERKNHLICNKYFNSNYKKKNILRIFRRKFSKKKTCMLIINGKEH